MESIGWTTSSVACYCRGTLIRTARGERPVEGLGIGDQIITMSGAARPIKWVGRRSYGGRFIMGRRDILPICIKAGALEQGVPRRDLFISPHHAMYLDGVLIEAKDLVNGHSITQAIEVDEVEYFHLELASHDVILAEGALSETYVDDDNRGMFHNAQDYLELYPDLPPQPVRYCAPRVEDGEPLARVRRRIAARAGIAGADQGPRIGPLRGFVERVDASLVAGWAQHAHHPEAPVCLDILLEGQLIGRALANSYRRDLEQAGLGSGCHAFTFVPPAGLDLQAGRVEVVRSIDGASLPPLAISKAPVTAIWRRTGSRPH